MRRLVVHIGAGKTGSTSIQMGLKQSRAALAERGIKYLGLMLEAAENKLYPWQSPGTHIATQRERLKLFVEEAAGIIFAEADKLPEDGVLIWSNEQFLRMSDLVIPVLDLIKTRGSLQFSVIVYLRAHDEWARSAYFQWGIKHKTYSGPVRGFKSWVAESPPRFSPLLKPWDERFSNQLEVRNFDAVGDVVKDFGSLLGVDLSSSGKANESLQLEDLYLRSLFNSQFSAPTSVAQFNKDVAPRAGVPGTVGLHDFCKMLPSASDLAQVWADSTLDVMAVNTLLAARGQAPLQPQSLSRPASEIDLAKLVERLSEIVVSQATRLSEVERQLADLKQVPTASAVVPMRPKPEARVSNSDSTMAGKSAVVSRPGVAARRPVILGKTGRVKGFRAGDSIDEPFRQTGNTGNIAFQTAISEVLFGSGVSSTSYGANQRVTAALGDTFVIPCANQLGKHTNLQSQMEYLQTQSQAVVAIGLGRQNDDDGSIPVLQAGTKGWLHEVCARSPSGNPNVAVRGEYSRRIMEKYGLGKSAVVLGCPSLHLSADRQLGATIAKAVTWPPRRVAVTGGSTPRIPSVLESSLADLATKTGGRYIVQHPVSMVKLANGEFDGVAPAEIEGLRKLIRPEDSLKDFVKWVKDHFSVFFDVDDWWKCIRSHDFVIGTRFHGTMLAIQAGVPALCVVHDSRTLELCQTMKLPYCLAEDVIKGGIGLGTVERYFQFSPSEFDVRRRELAEGFSEFLKGNGVLVPECKLDF